MRRKLVKQGAATLMVSLPADWIRQHGLGKGDEIDVEEEQGKLCISKVSQKEKSSTTIRLTSPVESSVRTSIINAYRAGYDILNIEYGDERCMVAIQSTLEKYLLGFDILERHKNSCILTSISEPAFEQFHSILQKLITNIGYVIHASIARLQKKTPFPDYEAIIFKTYQYDNFCRRIIAKQHFDREFLPDFMGMLINALHEFLFLNRLLDKQPCQVEHTALAHLDDAFLLIQKAFTKKDHTAVEKLHETQLGYEHFSEDIKNPKRVIPLYHLALASRFLYLSTGPLLGYLLKQPSA
ncbi:MAG: AbrB/MazE/SpoVT family DNA-binding domain-containing protein [archaeon]